MKRAIRKCCGTCKHWGRPEQKDEWRECQDDPPSPLSTAAHHGCKCPDWKSKRPARKPAPFRRWKAFGERVTFDGHLVAFSPYHVGKNLVAALNRHRVVLPKGSGK